MRRFDDVEGLNVINDPKCNKALNVITLITVIIRVSAALK